MNCRNWKWFGIESTQQIESVKKFYKYVKIVASFYVFIWHKPLCRHVLTHNVSSACTSEQNALKPKTLNIRFSRLVWTWHCWCDSKIFLRFPLSLYITLSDNLSLAPQRNSFHIAVAKRMGKLNAPLISSKFYCLAFYSEWMARDRERKETWRGLLTKLGDNEQCLWQNLSLHNELEKVRKF